MAAPLVSSCSSPGPCAKLAPKLIRSWALDAIEYVDEPGAHAPPKQSEVADFVAGVAAAPSKRFKCVGLGETIRFFDDKITGGALAFGDRAIHVMAFSLECLRLRQGAHTFT